MKQNGAELVYFDFEIEQKEREIICFVLFYKTFNCLTAYISGTNQSTFFGFSAKCGIKTT